jgi:hypothetical protein
MDGALCEDRKGKNSGEAGEEDAVVEGRRWGEMGRMDHFRRVAGLGGGTVTSRSWSPNSSGRGLIWGV